jgi:hypothetical protein
MNFSVIRRADTLWAGQLAMGLALEKKHLILLGKHLDALEALAHRIHRDADVHIHCFTADDAVTEDIVAVCDHINMHFEVDFLLNFTDIRFAQKLEDYDIRQLDSQLRVNHAACTLYLHQLLPNLLSHGTASVLQLWCCNTPLQPWQQALVDYNEQYASFLNRQWEETGLTIKNLTVEVPDNSEGAL